MEGAESVAQVEPARDTDLPECDRLLRNTKRQVKQMMEEAIARKSIHDESAIILALCVTVDSCLTHGLKRRALGLFKTSSSTALVKRIAKKCPAASQVLEQVEAELAAAAAAAPAPALKRNLWIRRALVGKRLVEIVEYLAERADEFYERDALMSSHLCAQILISLLVGPSALEFSTGKLNTGLHQQLAEPSAHELMRRHRLANRVACLCQSAAGAASLDSACTSLEAARSPSPSSSSASTGSPAGSIQHQQQQQQQQQVRQLGRRRRPLALRGPGGKQGAGTLATDCHHYSCQEMSEHQPATRGYSLVDGSAATCSSRQPAAEWALWSPSMLHEMLHQNAKSRLLYAKNNILLEVRGPNAHVAGYLSLHETSQVDLIMNWIPNQMIKGGSPSNNNNDEHYDNDDSHIEPTDEPTSKCCEHFKPHLAPGDRAQQQQQPVESSYLELVVSLSVSRIVLIQCQFQPQSSSKLGPPERLVLVEADGVQRAPFKFPKGGLRQFLACLDGGLRPLGRRLESAVWVEDAVLSEKSSAPSCHDDHTACASPRSDTESEGAPSGRLDSLLKRLPSLRWRAPLASNNHNQWPNFDTDHRPADSSATNFVYRIVTEPDATCLNSSSSCSPPPGSTDPSTQPPRVQQQLATGSLSLPTPATSTCNSDHPEPANSRFQWSLKRLAQLSYRYSNSSSTGSSVLNQSTSATSATASESTALPSPAPLDHTDDSSSLDYLLHHQKQLPLPDTCVAEGDEERDNSRELARVEAKLEQIKKSTSEEVLVALRTRSVQALCESMRKQILARAFYGWLAYCRRARIIRQHLRKLVKESAVVSGGVDDELSAGLSMESWRRLMDEGDSTSAPTSQSVAERVCLLVYHGGIESDQLRHLVWPYLLEYYSFAEPAQQREARDHTARLDYESQGREWLQVERVVKQRDREILAANIARAGKASKMKEAPQNHLSAGEEEEEEKEAAQVEEEEASDSFDEQPAGTGHDAKAKLRHAAPPRRRYRLESTGSVGSDASITDHFGNNIHRIDKDVQRCDRNFWYFKEPKNLDKLRNIMCTYVWQHLDMGYVQGMCDLAAPLLVIFDDECLAYNCFCQLMKRMVANFPHGRAMDEHFESLKHLMQIMDPKLFEILESNGDYAHFYFCYRWLLLDFKRELVYEDVYRVWETIWAARFVATDHFVVFMALAMVRYYRDIIIDNNMDFTDTIKFFNEMAERHDTKMILALARDCIVELQYLIKIN